MLLAACRRLGDFVARCQKPGYLPRGAAVPLGLHLEGPFLSPKAAGAHRPSLLHAPDLDLARSLIAAAGGRVAIVTLAPELPGALPLIRELARAGVRVQLGHTRATAEQARHAARAGATGITHLFNAMAIHHRSPGLLGPLLEGRLTAELITDGIHLAPEFVRWCHQAAGPSLYAVSDGCAAAGCRSRQPLTLGPLSIRRQGDAAVLPDGTLAGGATALAEHPRRLGDRRLLPLFYALQRRLFPAEARRPLWGLNHFDRSTLRFLGRG
jgi:N-acetylglucosamine-6-phosphate deacetylase